MDTNQAAKVDTKKIPPNPPTVSGGIIDSHAHVVEEYFTGERDEVIARARALGVTKMVNPAVNFANLDELKGLAHSFDFIYGACGLHPHDAKDWSEDAKELVRSTLSDAKFVAVGECGLDYFYDNSPREQQLKCFADQIDLAVELDKPIIVHCRDAWEDAFDLLTRHGKGKVRGVFHCFTGGPEHLEPISKLDFYVSFSGILTYKKAPTIQAAAPHVRADRFLVETDCPFLAPQKVRGMRNEPSFVWWTAEKLAELRNTTLEEVAKQASENASQLFGLSN